MVHITDIDILFLMKTVIICQPVYKATAMKPVGETVEI